MSNLSDFVIENGILKKYMGKDDNVIIPEGVTEIDAGVFQHKFQIKSVSLPSTLVEIGEGAFQQCNNIKEVVIPERVEKLGNYAFYECARLEFVEFKGKYVALNASAFSGCKKLKKINLSSGFFATKLRRPSMMIPFATEIKEKDIAYLWMFQDDKWLSWLWNKKVDMSAMDKEMLDIVLQLEKLTPKLLTRLIDYVGWAYPVINAESVQSLFDAVKEKDVKVAKKFLDAEPVQRVLNNERVLEEAEPIEEFAVSLLESQPLHPKANIFTKGIHYVGKEKNCTPQLLNILVSEYLYLYDVYQKTVRGSLSTYVKLDVPTHAIIPQNADRIASALDREELSAVLENLVYSCNKEYRPWMYVYARFATEASVQKLLHYPPSGNSAKVRYWRENLDEAMVFSETKVAVDRIDKNGQLDKYAYIRKMSVQELRDKRSLPEWDMDETGMIKSAFGKYGFVLNPEFVLRPIELASCKELRSISVKEDPNVANEFKELKKEVTSFYKKKAEYIRTIYITAQQIDAHHWRDTYCNNPILRPVTQKVIWRDATGTMFMLEQNRVMTVNGEEYSPEKWVKVAHVIEMSEEQIGAWRDKLAENGKKLLIEQVWEPIASIEDIDSFTNMVLSAKDNKDFKSVLRRKGISVKSDVASAYNHREQRFVFGDIGIMNIGNSLKMRYHVNESCGEITMLRFWGQSRYMTREINTILYELQCACVKTAIRKDDAEQLSKLLGEHFTIVQIMEFIKMARMNESSMTMAILLNYKNRQFGEFDPMDEFLLDL